MAQKDIQIRHASIINKLKKGRFTYREIQRHLSEVGEIQGYQLITSEKTFKRDREDILSLYQIDIQCHKPSNTYYILNNEYSQLNDKLLDALNIFNAVNTSVGLDPYFDLEKNASTGTEFMTGILYAIRNRLQLSIQYQSFWDEFPSERVVHPYFLKEFKNLWYIIVKNTAKGEIRTYALDRIMDISISKVKFTYPENLNPKDYFENSFGITTGVDTALEEVVLSFETHQGKYIKSLPLHKSQQVVEENDDELIVKLKVHFTFDFEMQLLSYGENVKILKPESFKQRIKKRLENTLTQYQ